VNFDLIECKELDEMDIDVKPRAVPQEVDAVLKAIAADLPPGAAAMMLSNVANRAVAVLHKLAREQGKETKGQASWGRWASLTNVSRDAVLRTATCRDTATQLYEQESAQED
jgi:hypothetical protein